MMKKTLFFAGVVALCVFTGAMANFADDSVTSPAFTDSYTAVSSDNGRVAAGTYQYAAKAETDNNVRIKHATTKYVDARKAGAQQLVDDLTDRSDDDDDVVQENNEELVGKTVQTTWEDIGMDDNRQVKTTSHSDECDNLSNEYSGCGYITKNANSVRDTNNFGSYSKTSSDYQWVKIVTNCAVQGQSSAPNCVSSNNNG